MGMVGLQIEMARLVEELIAHAREHRGSDGRRLIEREDLGAHLATLRAEVAALRAMAYMNISRHERGVAGLEATMAALHQAELERKVTRTALAMIGARGLELTQQHDDWSRRYLWSFPMTIAGGTSQIRRNIIAERILGMPRS